MQCGRTTLDIENVVLKQLRAIQKRQGGTLGSIASRLLAQALARGPRRAASPAFRWTVRKMEASVDLAAKEAVYAVLDGADRTAET